MVDEASRLVETRRDAASTIMNRGFCKRLMGEKQGTVDDSGCRDCVIE